MILVFYLLCLDSISWCLQEKSKLLIKKTQKAIIQTKAEAVWLVGRSSDRFFRRNQIRFVFFFYLEEDMIEIKLSIFQWIADVTAGRSFVEINVLESPEIVGVYLRRRGHRSLPRPLCSSSVIYKPYGKQTNKKLLSNKLPSNKNIFNLR